MITFTPGISGARVEPLAGPATGAPSTALSPKRASVTFDRTWTPYIQGTIDAQLLTQGDLGNIDPRSGLCVKLTLQQTFNGVLQQLPLITWLRSRSNNFQNAETSVGFASVEALMQDYVDPNGGQYDGAGTQTDISLLRDRFQGWAQLLPGLATTIQTIDGSPSFNVANTDAGWDAGSTVWDNVNTLESQKSLWIRGDESGAVVQRMNANYTVDTSLHVLSENDRILSVVDTIDRDNSDWANGVFINYRWNNGASAATDYGVLGPAPYKTAVIERTGRRTATGEATARATRMRGRGRALNLTAIADLTCRPNQNYRVDYLGYAWTTKVQAVTFRFPEGLMDLTLNVVES